MAAFTFLLALCACVLLSETEAQYRGQPRLVGRNGVTSSSLTAGRLEVYYNGQWGTVCDSGFGSSEARTACLDLGYSDYLDYGTVNSFIDGYRFQSASSSTPTWLDGLYCTSFDSTLNGCTRKTIGTANCEHSEDVFVSCLGSGAIRLNSYYSTSYAGRLEIYYLGSWGTVCDDGFGQTEANVACRQLGYSSALSYGNVLSQGYSEGTGTIWLDEVSCTSSNSMLSTCSHNTYGSTDCSHSEDIAITCSTDFSDILSGLSTGIIVAIVVSVLVPIICIIVCVVIIIIAVCTGACCAAGASNRRRNRRGFQNFSNTEAPPATTVATTTGTAQAQYAPPPYSNQGQTYPQTQYPAQQTAPYPTNPAAGGVPPQAAPPQPYPDQKQQREMQQYPGGGDPAYPPPGTAPYPTAQQ